MSTEQIEKLIGKVANTPDKRTVLRGILGELETLRKRVEALEKGRTTKQTKKAPAKKGEG